MALVDKQFIATAGGISPGLRAMKNDGTFVASRHLEPERHTERLAAAKVAHRGFNRMVTGEFDCLAATARDEHVVTGRTGSMVGWLLFFILLLFVLF